MVSKYIRCNDKLYNNVVIGTINKIVAYIIDTQIYYLISL